MERDKTRLIQTTGAVQAAVRRADTAGLVDQLAQSLARTVAADLEVVGGNAQLPGKYFWFDIGQLQRLDDLAVFRFERR